MEIKTMDEKWGRAVDEVNRAGRDGGAETGLLQAERRQEIVRKKLLQIFAGAVAPHLSTGTKALPALGNELDLMTDAIVQNAAKDGQDLDGEIIDLLVQASANIHAIQVKWQETINLMNTK